MIYINLLYYTPLQGTILPAKQASQNKMAFYGPPAPFQLYAYPMPIPNHEIYAVYPSGGGGVAAAPLDGTQFYYEPAAPKSSYSGELCLFHSNNAAHF